jgi:hypothetical protein
MSWLPTISTSTLGTTVSPSIASTSFARKRENGSPRRRSTTSLTMLRAKTNTSATSIVRSAADSAYSTTSLRKSGFSSVERSARRAIANSAAMSTKIPSRMRRGLSRNGRRSAVPPAGAGRAGSVGRVASRRVLMSMGSRETSRPRAGASTARGARGRSDYRRNVNLASPAIPPSHGQTNDAFRGVVWARTRR